MKQHFAGRIETPIGSVLAVVDDGGALVALEFEDALSAPALERRSSARGSTLEWDRHALREVSGALERYFTGELREFALALALEGTPFQRTVWGALRRIPYGRTISYAELARAIGSPRAVRAVGRANGANPIPIVVPCHRVIAADGSLGGYGGGLERKRALLRLEGAGWSEALLVVPVAATRGQAGAWRSQGGGS